MPFKTYNFTFASGATGTNKQFVGPHTRAAIILSNVTAFNAAAGNMNVSWRCGLSETDTHADVVGASVTTETAKGCYQVTSIIGPYVSLGLGTACTGSATNSIDVIVYTPGY